MKKRTKIICTLGPSTQTISVIVKLIRAGMNVARLNFSHGTHENHLLLIKNIRKASEKTGISVAILQDLQGPKIRIGILPKEGIGIVEKKKVVFDTSIKEYKNNIIPIVYKDLEKYLKKGERILLNDGRVEVLVDKVVGKKIYTTSVVSGELSSNKGINLPDSKLSGVKALTEKDIRDAEFGVKNGVDFIALSFVMDADDIIDLRYLIKKYQKKYGKKGDSPIRIIAKIERTDAVENIKEIVDATDAIMVARGDLGVEIPAEEVPFVQKHLIDLCLDYAKPVIVATQMLDSMQNNPRPTRAEVSDVANAVIDHTDVVMLSNETAAGKYPIETVDVMTRIIVESEKSHYDNLEIRDFHKDNQKLDNIISGLSRVLSEYICAKLILVASLSGDTGRLISRYRPELPILVATGDSTVERQLQLSWGVHSFVLPECKSIEELVERSVAYIKKKRIAKKGDKIVVVAGEPVGQAGHVNLLEVREIK